MTSSDALNLLLILKTVLSLFHLHLLILGWWWVLLPLPYSSFFDPPLGPPSNLPSLFLSSPFHPPFGPLPVFLFAPYSSFPLPSTYQALSALVDSRILSAISFTRANPYMTEMPPHATDTTRLSDENNQWYSKVVVPEPSASNCRNWWSPRWNAGDFTVSSSLRSSFHRVK